MITIASSIKGITIEIDGNTTGLQKALSDVDKTSRSLTSELRQVDRALKFDPGNVELVAQKQQILAQQVEITTTRLNRLKSAQQQVEAQFQSGNIGADQFRAFQREIINTEGRLKRLGTELAQLDDNNVANNVSAGLSKVDKEAQEATDSVQSLAEGLEDLEAFSGLAGDVLSKSFGAALDSSSLETKIDISFDVPESSMKSVKDAIKQIEAYGVDGQTALEGVRRQWALNKDASDASNTAIVKGAATIAASYSGLDFTQVIQQINGIAGELNISNEAALGLTSALLKAGFPPENIDQITEYGAQLSRAGYTAEEIQAIFAAGIDTKSWNIDNLMDGLKEGRIRMAEFGQEVPKAMQNLLKGTDISTKQLQTWGKQIAKGGAGGKKAMQDVATALKGVDDSTKQNALGVQIFGTMWEDQGANILDAITNANKETVDLSDNQKQLNADVQQMNADPAVQFAKAMSDLKTAMTPVLETIAQLVSAFSQWVSANPVLAATITAIVAVVGLLLGALASLAPIFIALTAAATFFGVGLGTVIGVVAAVIAAIAGLITIGVAVYQNWDSITASLTAAWQWIKASAISIFSAIVSFLSGVWSGMRSTAISTWNTVRSFLSGVWGGIRSNATSVFNGIRSFLSGVWSSIRSTVSSTWNAVRSVIANAWSGIKSTISSGIRSAYSTVVGYVGTFRTAGSSLLSALADGIRNGISKAVSAVSNGMAKIRSYLPFSPAKVGPLSDLDKSGESFFPTFASKMHQGVAPMLDAINDGLGRASVAVEGVQTKSIQLDTSTLPTNSGVTIIIQGDAILDNDQRMNQWGNKISQAMQRAVTIEQRAQGVRVYGKS